MVVIRTSPAKTKQVRNGAGHRVTKRFSSLLAAVLLAGACSGDPQVTTAEFTGSECLADLPVSVEPGNHTFLLTNTSDRTSLPVYVVELREGHTYEEFAALQAASGDYFVLPDWAQYGLRDLDLDESDPDGQRQYRFTLRPGDHAVYLWASRPAAIWLCGPLTVAPS